MTFTHYPRNLKYQEQYTPPASNPSPCFGYYIKKKLYARSLHNSFTESVACETYRQTMGNLKLRT